MSDEPNEAHAALPALLRAMSEAGDDVTLSALEDGRTRAECSAGGHLHAVTADTPLAAASELAVRLGWDLE